MTATADKPALAPSCAPDRSEPWIFQLYVAGMSRSTRVALANLQAICEAHLPDQHSIEVVDMLEEPERAAAESVLAVPMLVRVQPKPTRRIVGDLSTTERVLAGLDLPLQP